MFDEKTQQALGYYVYMLIDPSNNKPFYVGKGKNNRVFDHIEYAFKNPSDCSDKCWNVPLIWKFLLKSYCQFTPIMVFRSCA